MRGKVFGEGARRPKRCYKGLEKLLSGLIDIKLQLQEARRKV
jgi:hypothetical protein